jgi:tRNA(Ile)-lysidine synthase
MMPGSGDAPRSASSLVSPEEAIARFLDRLPPAFRLLVAFSGGSDSYGLLAILAEARRRRSGLDLHAATVDHGLRPGSAKEAHRAGGMSRKLGVPHTILTWEGTKPATGIQAAARAARYRLLAAEAARVGADAIVTAHTRDDQAETVAMRAARNASAAAGMDEAVLIGRRHWVLRPLLSAGREAIRSFLRHRRLEWIDDPSNDNPAFERIRVRKSAPPALENGPVASPVAARAVVSAQFIRTHVVVHGLMLAVVDLEHCHVRHPSYWTALATLSAVLGGRVHGPGEKTSAGMIERLASGADVTMTANRVLFDRRGKTLYMMREARDLPVVTLRAGDTVAWDDRFSIRNAGGEVLEIGAGRVLRDHPPLLPDAGMDDVPPDIRRRLLDVVPRVLQGKAGQTAVRPILAPFEHFLPATRLPLADSLAEIFGIEHFPALPLADGLF